MITTCILCSEQKKGEIVVETVASPLDEQSNWFLDLSVSGTFEIFETAQNRCRTDSIAIFSFENTKISISSSIDSLKIYSTIGSIRLTETCIQNNVFKVFFFFYF